MTSRTSRKYGICFSSNNQERNTEQSKYEIHAFLWEAKRKKQQQQNKQTNKQTDFHLNLIYIGLKKNQLSLKEIRFR